MSSGNGKIPAGSVNVPFKVSMLNGKTSGNSPI